MAFFLPGVARPAADPIVSLRGMSIEDRSNIESTSVSRRAEPLAKAPAAVYVITNDDIRRAGVNSLPEALRLAPNLQVARVKSRSYSISARGFNTYEAFNKLLALIDGRSIYTPLHAGVLWGQQQMVLERGPGGTLWGANAVNGVLNIITKNSVDTQGAPLSTQVGNPNQNASIVLFTASTRF